MEMGMLMRSLEQTGNGIFHVLYIASIVRIERSQSQIAAQHGDTVHHVQISIRLGKLCCFFKKVFRRNSADTHVWVRCNSQTIGVLVLI